MLSKVVFQLMTAGVIPSVIPFFTQRCKLFVEYPGYDVYPALHVPHSITALPPHVWHDYNHSSVFTLAVVVVDISLRFRNSCRQQYLMWLVASIPGNNLAQGRELAEYQPPSSFPEDEEHNRHCVFLLYRDAPDSQHDPVPSDRSAFDVNAYTLKAGLTLIGANYFIPQH
ncbi:39S ribosomal protein L38, mitochondrial [Dispira parvispora]|uniref:39S ribosomal protein L38, mitochondrial n=1 Tax=Dispira parvispora TaxID=1520584 RepID=A0A9W8ARP8_9FUNG|nr:39S ribosomal protein L38, mitochondrial [Dispira parvispora]